MKNDLYDLYLERDFIHNVLCFPLTDDGSFTISVGSGSTLGETCGICGSQGGELLFRNGSVATNPGVQQEFVDSYRVTPDADMALRLPIRQECGKFMASHGICASIAAKKQTGFFCTI